MSGPPFSAPASAPVAFRRSRGAILFEVVLALVLFAAAAAIISGGMNASLRSVERLRLQTHAANLAVSVLAELQIGVRSLDVLGPENFEDPFAGWSWEIVTTTEPTDAMEDNPPLRVEVIIRHEDPPMVYRLAQFIQLGELTPAPEDAGVLESPSASPP